MENQLGEYHTIVMTDEEGDTTRYVLRLTSHSHVMYISLNFEMFSAAPTIISIMNAINSDDYRSWWYGCIYASGGVIIDISLNQEEFELCNRMS
jgi:hypothetical protein